MEVEDKKHAAAVRLILAAITDASNEELRAKNQVLEHTKAIQGARGYLEVEMRSKRDVKALWAALMDGEPEVDESVLITSSHVNLQTQPVAEILLADARDDLAKQQATVASLWESVLALIADRKAAGQ